MLRVFCLQITSPPKATLAESPEDQILPALEGFTGQSLVMLPELWQVGYFAFEDYRVRAMACDDPLLDRYSKKARELGLHLHIGSMVERADNGLLYNTSLVFGPDGARLAEYRKIHLFGHQSREAELLAPGREVVVASTAWGRVGLATCYDLRFPELFRAMIDRGAEFILVTAAWPAERIETWRILLKARAIENQCFIIATNGCGYCRGVELGGHSMVVDPRGRILAELDGAPGILSVELDPAAVAQTRFAFRALEDRVPFLNAGSVEQRFTDA